MTSTVLIADDSMVVRAVLREQLESQGFVVKEAPDGDAALVACRREPPDIVLLDVDMPLLNGYQVMTEMRQMEQTQETPVVFLTGRSDAVDAVEALRLGAHDYLRKPVEPIELVARVSAALRLKGLQDELHRRNADLSDQTRRLEQVNAELQAANQLAADLLAMLSHDLRQPLTTIIAHAEMLVDDWEATPDDRKLMSTHRVSAAARLLNQLVENVLTMARIDAKSVPAHREAVAIGEVVTEALAAFAYEPGDFDIRIADSTEALVDRGHLLQVLANLLGNATKYGLPPVTVSATELGSIVEIRICDQGQGVPADFVPHLFDRFTRATTGTAITKKGTGLGLFIVRQLALANHGSVHYEPNQPQGGCFVVRLEPVPGP